MPVVHAWAMRSASVVVLAAPALASMMRVRSADICTATCSSVGVMRLGWYG